MCPLDCDGFSRLTHKLTRYRESDVPAGREIIGKFKRSLTKKPGISDEAKSSVRSGSSRTMPSRSSWNIAGCQFLFDEAVPGPIRLLLTLAALADRK